VKARPYLRMEKAIAASDAAGIRERWEYGRRLLVDETATTEFGTIRIEVVNELLHEAERTHVRLSRREIQRRLQIATAYPTEQQLCKALEQYETWWDLTLAGFPEIPAPEDARPFDPRGTRELAREHEARGARLFPEGDQQQLALELFPKHDGESTLAELEAYAREQTEITARFNSRDAKRRQYLEELIDAVAGDMTKTVSAALAALNTATSGETRARGST
jgi:hypothetical protein